MKEIKTRHHWMDALRGAAIILVVHFHVTNNIEKYPNPPEMLLNLTYLIAPLRMPILVLLSGLLVSNSILKGQKKYFSGKIKNVAYPFLIWTVIMYALSFAKEAYLGDPMEATFLQALTVSPLYHLWFLQFLFIYYVVIFYLRKLNPLFVFAGSIALYLIFYGYADDRLISLFCFFTLGSYIGQNLNEVSEKVKAANPILLLASLSLAILFSVLNTSNNLVYSNLYYLLSALFFIPVLIKMFMLIENTQISKILEFFGMGSLVIYLAHVPILTVVYNITKRTYSGNPLSVYLILMFFTVVMCIVTLYASRKIQLISFLFSPVKLKNDKSLTAINHSETLNKPIA